MIFHYTYRFFSYICMKLVDIRSFRVPINRHKNEHVNRTFSLIQSSTLSTCSLNSSMSLTSPRPFPRSSEAFNNSFHLDISRVTTCLIPSDDTWRFFTRLSPSCEHTREETLVSHDCKQLCTLNTHSELNKRKGKKLCKP